MEIKIPAEICSYIESVDREISSRRDLLAYMITLNQNTKTEAFTQYQNEYTTFFRKMQLLKEEIEEKYVKPFLDENNYSYADWKVNFEKVAIEISNVQVQNGD